ncbi:MAG: hypothetical protein MK074_04980 [Phycisphaerales bacterium]|nr:hypothetical protein [Phycisphaerales bacterium]
MPPTGRKAPTFFHHRLRLLSVLACACVGVLMLQAVRLSVLGADASLERAQSRLRTHRWLPTWRGSIVDRNGTVLARDEPRWAAAVSWDALTGRWADDRAAQDARAAAGAQAWAQYTPDERHRAIDTARAPYADTLEALWDALAKAGGVDRGALDERLHATRGRVQRLAAVVWDRQRRAWEARVGIDGARFTARPIAEQVQPHVLLGDIDDATAIDLVRFADTHEDLVDLQYVRRRVTDAPPGTVLIDTEAMPRDARQGTIEIQTGQPAAMLVGTVRDEVWKEDVQRRPFRNPATGDVDRGGYRLDDIVGASGMERAAEDVLRGDVGRVTVRRDTGEEHREDPRGGDDVRLTLDAHLQRHVEAVLDPAAGLTVVQPWHTNEQLTLGTRLPASVVVLDVPTGEILAMAATPGRGELDSLTQSDQHALTPWLMRPVQIRVAPGSIVKPLIFAAAAADGLVSVDDPITCNGHHIKGHPGVARCWTYRPQYGMATHGPLAAQEALARSCNCYFYELGERMGLDSLAAWFNTWGMGSSPDIGLTPPEGMAQGRHVEAAGLVPDADQRAAIVASGEGLYEAIAQAIGQGRLAWTPLHAADAFATLARGGRIIEPTLVVGHQPARTRQERLLPQAAVDAALAGLNDAATQWYGTGARIKYDDNDREPIITASHVKVHVKTGTAQAPPWVRDVDGDAVIAPGERVGDLEHAWYVALVDDDTSPMPRYAIAVLVEYGGSGGRVAGPIADQVIHALQSTGWISGELP